MGMKFWVPRHKWELVEWLVESKVLIKSKAVKMSKAQLYAIYYRIRSAE